jgi:hypothetical protein
VGAAEVATVAELTGVIVGAAREADATRGQDKVQGRDPAKMNAGRGAEKAQGRAAEPTFPVGQAPRMLRMTERTVDADRA